MTTAPSLVYYPQYCFHLSPTINKWCPFRAIDIAGLECRAGFEDIDVFFALNHPIRWVRIIGVVVAVDDYYGHRVYTVDDSTGKCIECALAMPNAIANKTNPHNGGHSRDAERPAGHVAVTDTTPSITTTTPPTDIDVGMTVDVKGSVKLFRGQRQIKIQKVTRVLSTNQEVLFWDKIRDFRRDVLSQPWVLKDREVRRCRKLQQAEAAELEAKKSKGNTGQQVERASASRDGTSGGGTYISEGRPKNSLADASTKLARAQRAAQKESMRLRAGHGKRYDALGL
ncbi:hypothetical protein F4861DRAFT_464486 [Xylaria intraflava]|nr:hypothetical protein F4861DRAFT_464486 [Xylaria intraflava]